MTQFPLLVISLISALWKGSPHDGFGACPPPHLPAGQLGHIHTFFNIFPNRVGEKLSGSLSRTVYSGGRERAPGGFLLCPFSISDEFEETQALKRSNPGTSLIYKRHPSMR